MLDWLYEERGKEYLEREYVNGLRAAANIANELGIYPVEVLKALRYHGIPTRNKSEARLASLRIGHSIPSMLGRRHPEEVKRKISQSIRRNRHGQK